MASRVYLCEAVKGITAENTVVSGIPNTCKKSLSFGGSMDQSWASDRRDLHRSQKLRIVNGAARSATLKNFY